LPDLLKYLKAKDILRITGDEDWLARYYAVLVNSWYIRNLISIGYHTPEEALILKEAKLKELLKNKEAAIKYGKEYWAGFKPRARVDITGERVALMAELETLANFINLEADPVRRTALIELAMKKKGIDIERLPKTPPGEAMAIAGRTPQSNAASMSQQQTATKGRTT